MIDIWFLLGWEVHCCKMFICREMSRASD